MATMQAVLRGLLAVGALLLGACTTMSPYSSGYVTATEEDAKVVKDGGFSEKASAQIVIYQNPDFNGGKISAKALRKIQEYSMSCQRQIDAQLAGPVQSTVSGAVTYGVAGTGTGLAAKAADFVSKVLTSTNYAIYGGVAYILPGGVNGAVSGSYAMASAKGTCTRDFWADVSKSDPDFRGTHVGVAHAGKAPNSRPPALDTSATAKPPAPPLSR